jgi:hypothetical protein
MGASENIDTDSSRITSACAVYEHAAICVPLSRSISRVFRLSATTDSQIFPDVDLQQSFEEAA